MDDLIVLILTLIIFVAGAIGQIKKKKPPVSDAGKNQQTDNFWDLLEQETEIFRDQPVQPEREIQPVVYQEKYESTEPENYEFTPVNEGGSVLAVEKNTEKKIPVRERLLKEGFSLKKAVVYSEILNRKYF